MGIFQRNSFAEGKSSQTGSVPLKATFLLGKVIAQGVGDWDTFFTLPFPPSSEHPNAAFANLGLVSHSAEPVGTPFLLKQEFEPESLGLRPR